MNRGTRLLQRMRAQLPQEDAPILHHVGQLVTEAEQLYVLRPTAAINKCPNSRYRVAASWEKHPGMVF